ncbi:MAG: DUF6285 domain-containing protein [Alphaproteobacteria bacterium]|jgi:hypothetical protein|nr:DUF6285 domain-containing protein [Alphaproteobacteria bacterium]MDP6563561.1 DUF6285 domain-containing protein [Alphaproteobacteria bacterium]MDP6815000.1 DUF6285 domain-containing protein [Alphaproteobacteria bacterium]
MAQDRPNVDNLLATAIEDLAALSGGLPDDERFRVRVCTHLLSIVRRELAQAGDLNAAEQARLQDLLGHDGDLAALNEELSARIRAGELDERWTALSDHLRRSAIERLAVVNPDHLRPEDSPEPADG